MIKTVLIKLSALTSIFILLSSCTSTGPGLFRKKSPHEQYVQKLKNAGLDNTTLGKRWIEQAIISLDRALTISVPYSETGYFSAERIQASALEFVAKRGQRLTITLTQKPTDNFRIYVDLWAKKDNGNMRLVAYSDSTATNFNYEIDDEGSFLIRLQPELLVSGEYTLSIAAGPSLAFPVSGKGRNSIQSLYGVNRDAGARKHEGIDIFAARSTPAIAAAPGVVTRVTKNNLGGKVVFLRPEGKDYNLYYAHLDSQLVQDGKLVETGDTIGLIGNTGNAITTSPHLHFGIYTRSGAVDPLPYIDPRVLEPSPVTASLSRLNRSSRVQTAGATLQTSLDAKATAKTKLPPNTLFRIDAATRNLYKVTLPDGTSGFMSSLQTRTVENPTQKLKIEDPLPLLDNPDTSAARKMILPPGEIVNVLGVFREFYYIKNNDQYGWIERF